MRLGNRRSRDEAENQILNANNGLEINAAFETTRFGPCAEKSPAK